MIGWLTVGMVCVALAAVLALGKAGESIMLAEENKIPASNAILTGLMAVLVIVSTVCMARSLHLAVVPVESSSGS